MDSGRGRRFHELPPPPPHPSLLPPLFSTKYRKSSLAIARVGIIAAVLPGLLTCMA